MAVRILSSAARAFSQSSAPAACLASAKIAAGVAAGGGLRAAPAPRRGRGRRWAAARRRRGRRRDWRRPAAPRRALRLRIHDDRRQRARHATPQRRRRACRQLVNPTAAGLNTKRLERTDEAQLDVPELDDVARVQLDALVVLAVDADAVGALQVDDRVVVAVAHDLRVVARDRSVAERRCRSRRSARSPATRDPARTPSRPDRSSARTCAAARCPPSDRDRIAERANRDGGLRVGDRGHRRDALGLAPPDRDAAAARAGRSGCRPEATRPARGRLAAGAGAASGCAGAGPASGCGAPAPGCGTTGFCAAGCAPAPESAPAATRAA